MFEIVVLKQPMMSGIYFSSNLIKYIHEQFSIHFALEYKNPTFTYPTDPYPHKSCTFMGRFDLHVHVHV